MTVSNCSVFSSYWRSDSNKELTGQQLVSLEQPVLAASKRRFRQDIMTISRNSEVKGQNLTLPHNQGTITHISQVLNGKSIRHGQEQQDNEHSRSSEDCCPKVQLTIAE